MGLAEEKDVRSRLDTAVRQAQSKTFEFEDRIRRLEDAIKVSEWVKVDKKKMQYILVYLRVYQHSS